MVNYLLFQVCCVFGCALALATVRFELLALEGGGGVSAMQPMQGPYADPPTGSACMCCHISDSTVYIVEASILSAKTLRGKFGTGRGKEFRKQLLDSKHLRAAEEEEGGLEERKEGAELERSRRRKQDWRMRRRWWRRRRMGMQQEEEDRRGGGGDGRQPEDCSTFGCILNILH